MAGGTGAGLRAGAALGHIRCSIFGKKQLESHHHQKGGYCHVKQNVSTYNQALSQATNARQAEYALNLP